MLEVSLGILDEFWEPREGDLPTFCIRLNSFWGALGELWNVWEGLVCLLTAFWGLLKRVLEDLGTS